jgi:FkbM family methyltransferase
MEKHTYNPGQVAAIFPFVPDDVQWFLLAGPADGDEAQVFHKQHPACKIVGWEPNPDLFKYQVENDFPGWLLSSGLWSEETDLILRVPEGNAYGRSGSVARFNGTESKWDVEQPVHVVTLDETLRQFGKIHNAVLWMDIEFAELEALRGGQRLFNDGAIRVVNVEMHDLYHREVEEFLERNGFEEAERRDVRKMASGTFWDVTYVLK